MLGNTVPSVAAPPNGPGTSGIPLRQSTALDAKDGHRQPSLAARRPRGASCSPAAVLPHQLGPLLGPEGIRRPRPPRRYAASPALRASARADTYRPSSSSSFRCLRVEPDGDHPVGVQAAHVKATLLSTERADHRFTYPNR